MAMGALGEEGLLPGGEAAVAGLEIECGAGGVLGEEVDHAADGAGAVEVTGAAANELDGAEGENGGFLPSGSNRRRGR